MDNIIVRRMLDVIESDYADVVTLRTLSSTVGRQPAYLGRLFRHEVGSTAREYLTHVRLTHAAALVRDGVKIEAVALSVGYRSKKNFYRQFKKYYGTTPLLYRNEAGHDVASGSDAPSSPSGSAPQLVTAPGIHATDHSGDQRFDRSEPAPILGPVATIIRSSNRAWRLAIRAQQLMVKHFHRLQMAMFLTDDDGRYVGANRAALVVTGYSAAELRGLTPAALFIEPPIADVRCVWQLLLRHRSPGQSPNATLRTKAGNAVGVHLITLRNFLWGRRELSTILGPLPVAG